MQSYDEYVSYAFKRNGDLPHLVMKGQVSVKHLDGSTFNYYNGCIEIIDKFLIVYSEHHHPDIFFKEDLETWKGSEVGSPTVLKDQELLDRISAYSSENIFENQEPEAFESTTTEEMWNRAKDAYFTLKSHLENIVTQEGKPDEAPKGQGTD